MAEMRVLTVRQPWAWAIVHGGKDVENRVRNIAGDYRGPVAIHAGLELDDAGFEHPELRRRAWWQLRQRLGFGQIIGVVDLTGVHEERPWWMRETCACESDWAEIDVWHLCLANPRPLRTPIPFRGALGLRRLDAATIDLITKELA